MGYKLALDLILSVGTPTICDTMAGVGAADTVRGSSSTPTPTIPTNSKFCPKVAKLGPSPEHDLTEREIKVRPQWPHLEVAKNLLQTFPAGLLPGE